MSRTWTISVILAAAALLWGAGLEAQRSARLIDANTYGSKFSTGGFSAGFWTGMKIAGDLYRGTPVPTDTPGVSALGRGTPVERSESNLGLGLDWQFGSSSDVMGVNVSIDTNFYTIDTVNQTDPVTGLPGATPSSFAATVNRIGFNVIWNPVKSLGRHVLESGEPQFDDLPNNDYAFSVFFGPSITFMAGDLNNINGMATLGFDAGMVFDIPLGDANEFNITPSFWIETNYHFSGDAQIDIFNSTEQAPVGVGQNDGVVVRTHTLIPPFAWNLGGELVWRPRFGANQENNHWRFGGGLFLNVPFAFNAFFAEDPGDAYKTDGDGSAYLTLSLSASYVW